MIEHFQYFTEDGISLILNLGLNVYVFEGNAESLISKFYKDQSKGVKWVNKTQHITKFETGYKIYGYPTPDLQKVVVLYPQEHVKYPSPNNAVIYNAEGSIYMQLRAPNLISDLAKKSRLKPFGLYFDQVSWAKDSKDDIVISMMIGFNRDWREERVLNPETGEFGECLSSGRR